MKKLLVAIVLVISSVAHATDLNKIKSLAEKLHFVYQGGSDRMGGSYYLFYWASDPHILVAIPTDIRNDREAMMALNAAFASATRTYKRL